MTAPHSNWSWRHRRARRGSVAGVIRTRVSDGVSRRGASRKEEDVAREDKSSGASRPSRAIAATSADTSPGLPEPDSAAPLGMKCVRLYLKLEKRLVDGVSVPDDL